jgi:sulfite exporter TauE/SafE
MTLGEFSLVFALGLAASLHCVQMCGPIVISYSVSLARHGASRGGIRRQVLLAHLGYNAGRVLTYTALGALAGAAGSGIGMLGKLAGLASGARMVSGAAMIVTGLLILGVLPRKVLVQVERRGAIALFSRSVGRLLISSRALGKFGLGLILGFLPCGLIYGALLKAMETARPLAGALTMVAFGMGTAVALLGMGTIGSVAGLRLGGWGNRVAGASILTAGAILVWRGWTAGPVCHG